MGLGGEQGFLVSFVLRTLGLLRQAQGSALWQKEDPGPALEVPTLLQGEQCPPTRMCPPLLLPHPHLGIGFCGHDHPLVFLQ